MVRINRRDDIDWEEGMTVQRVLEVCRFTHKNIAVFVNEAVVLEADYATHPVRDGDDVQVIHHLAGG